MRPEDARAAIGRRFPSKGEALEPTSYAAQSKTWPDLSVNWFDWEESFSHEPMALDRLYALRHCALVAHEFDSLDSEGLESARRCCYEWVNFITAEESSSLSFFLRDYCAKDETFYKINKGEVTLVPKRQKDWSKGWNAKLRWLKSHRLTVPELELALVLFDWNGCKPSLARWATNYPQILWRVDRFLLRRYCFPLLKALRCATSGLGGSATRVASAGPLARIYPRICILAALGYSAIVGLHPVVAFLFGVDERRVFLGGVACCLFVSTLLYLVVHRGNFGVVSSKSEVLRRALWTWLHASVRAAGVGLFVALFWLALAHTLDPTRLVNWGEGHVSPGEGVIVPVLRWDWSPSLSVLAGSIVRWFAAGQCALLFGAMLEWFWEDRSWLEPF